jgi:hypothetical protein
VTGDYYDLMLHCTLGHMFGVDDAQPDFEDSAKALNFFAPKGEHRFIFCIYCMFCIFLFGVCIAGHILHTSQQVYGLWYYFMLYNGIGAHHQKILPKILPRSDSEVDMLLDGKLRVYVELAYYAYKSY